MAEYPHLIGYLWQWYVKLTRTRQIGMARNPITYTEIKAFCELYAIKMAPNDIDVLMQLDAISLQSSDKG